MDLWDVDVRRTFPFQSQPDFLFERQKRPWAALHMHWLHRQYATSRDIRLTPLHHTILATGCRNG